MKTRFSIVCVAILMATLQVVCYASATTTTDNIDASIREVSDYLNEMLPSGTKLAVINIECQSEALADYIFDELISNAVNDRNFQVVDRRQLEYVRAEVNFNMSGEVSDESAQMIGHLLGAQYIVTGRISKIANFYRFNVRAVEVQTARLAGSKSWDIAEGDRINALFGIVSATQPVETANPQDTPSTPTFRVGDTGPAGGIIFYDKGNNSGGWQYLEVAPADIEPAIFMPENLFMVASREGLIPTENNDTAVRAHQNFKVGSGFTNTQDLMVFANRNGGGFGWAVQLCDELEVNGYSDWFLPSYDELNHMYGNLHRRDLGGFRNDIYWSSSANRNGSRSFAINFADGSEKPSWIGDQARYRVRAVRRF